MKQYSQLKHYFINGQEYPRITTILDALAKPQLYMWYMVQGHKITLEKKPKDIKELYNLFYKQRQETLDRGSGVHTIAEQWFRTKSLPIPKNGYEEAFVAFVTEHGKDITPLYLETQVHCEDYKIAGRVDLVCRYKDKIYVVDFKTGKRFYPSVRLQLSAYSHCVVKRGYVKEMPLLMGILFKESGKYEIAEFDNEFESFKACLEMYKFLQKYDK